MNRLLPILAAAVLLPALVSTSPAQSVTGYPEILDGDTLRFGRRDRVRLAGVDAPEASQLCAEAFGKRYACGRAAREALKALVGSGPVSCKARQRDRYGRLIAVCLDAAGRDLAGRLVDQGWALAYRRYSSEYVPQELAARKAGRGLWRGRFIKPWQWRRGRRLE